MTMRIRFCTGKALRASKRFRSSSLRLNRGGLCVGAETQRAWTIFCQSSQRGFIAQLQRDPLTRTTKLQPRLTC